MSNESKAASLSEALEALSEPYDIYVLFVDLVGSTGIKKHCVDNSIPDSIWIMRQKLFLSRTSTIIKSHSGEIVKTIGDEIMAIFRAGIAPSEIFSCIIEVFQTFENLKSYNKGIFKIFAKAALDFGMCYDGRVTENIVLDPIGVPVDRCARMSKHAKQNQIVFSAEVDEIFQQNSFDLKTYSPEILTEDLPGLGNTKIHRITV